MKRAVKYRIVRLLLSCLAAAAAIALALFLRGGPKLGKLYDYLTKKLAKPPIANEILIIETGAGTVLDGESAALTVMALAEMGAADLLIEAPVLGISASQQDREAELLGNFEREFGIIRGNISNLFDGIRFGTIPPENARLFVDNVLKLTDEGRARLENEAVRRNGLGTLQLEEAKNVFPNVYIAGDLSMALARYAADESGAPGAKRPAALLYSRVEPDADDVLRRIAPLSIDGQPGKEHLVFNAIKSRYDKFLLENTEGAYVLVLEKENADDSGTKKFPLDKNGAILIQNLHETQTFRSISFADFIELDALERSVYKILTEKEELRQSAGINPENYPPYLWEREQEWRKIMLSDASTANKNAWRGARQAYFDALKSFFDEAAAENTVALIEENIGRLLNGSLSAEGEAQIAGLRETLVASFNESKALYRQSVEIRARFERELPGAFCIAGSTEEGTLSSALLANSLLSGVFITCAPPGQTAFWSICAALLCIILLRNLKPAAAFITGTIFSLLALAVFSYIFVLLRLWLDPIVPFCAVFAASSAQVLAGLQSKLLMKRTFRAVYGHAVSKKVLARLVKAGHPQPEEQRTVFAAIIAVRSPSINNAKQKDSAFVIAGKTKTFHEEACAFLTEAGAVIAGVRDDTVIGAFGSPLVRIARGQALSKEDICQNLAQTLKAVAAGGGGDWRYGADIGDCAFGWTPLAGFTAQGAAVQKAIVLADCGARAGLRVLLTKTCAENLNIPVKTRTLNSGNALASASGSIEVCEM